MTGSKGMSKLVVVDIVVLNICWFLSWFASLTLLLVLDSSQFGMDCHSNYRMCITFCSLIGRAAPLNQLS